MKRIFNPSHVLFLSLLLTPLAGMIMVGMDYRNAKKRSWPIVAIAPFVVILIASMIGLVTFDQSQTLQFILSVLLSLTYFMYSIRLRDQLLTPAYRGMGETIRLGVTTFILTLPLQILVLNMGAV